MPAQACESWPIRGDWAFQDGSFKETNGAAAMGSMRQMCLKHKGM